MFGLQGIRIQRIIEKGDRIMNVIEMKHVKKSFGDKEVLKDISFSIQEGEVVSIIGPSGSGKSTLLRCATFLERMDGGTISYLEEEVVKVARRWAEPIGELKEDFLRNLYD